MHTNRNLKYDSRVSRYAQAGRAYRKLIRGWIFSFVPFAAFAVKSFS